MRPLGIALIGYGSIGKVHLMGYRSLPFLYGFPSDRITIAGVATSRQETAQAAAAEIGCPVWTDDYRDLLARVDVDAVDICTPNYMHVEPVIAAAAAGKHIYCEKPLGLNVAEAQRMVEAVQEAGVVNQMTFNFRFFPALLKAKELIEAGFLGRIYTLRGRYYRSSYADPSRPLSWKLRRETSGAGALADIGSHVLDMLSYLLGDFAAVQATLDTLIPERPVAKGSTETGPVTVDDVAFLNLRTASGAVGPVEINRVATGTTNELQVEVYGEHGALRFDAADPAWLEVYDARQPGVRGFRRLETGQRYPEAQSPDWTQPPGFARSHAECQYRFLRAIWDGKPASPSLADGLHIQQVIAAAERSAAEGRWVSVDNGSIPIA